MNLFQGDTAAIQAFANERQGKRLLRLRFPRNDGPPRTAMLANRLDAIESLSKGYAYTVGVLSDSVKIDHDMVLGKMVTIELVREDGTLRYFNGYVFEFRLEKTDGGFAFYEMVLEPWLSYLKLRQDNAAFHKLSVGELTAKVVAQYIKRDLVQRVAGPDAPITYICQHNESDYNFLHRHWEERGWTYSYEHRADGHTLVLSDDSMRTAKPIDGSSSDIPFQHEAGAAEDDGIHQWSPRRRIRSDKMTVASFNFKHPRAKRVERISPISRSASPSLEIYENTGMYGFKDFNAGEALAQRRIEELDARHIEIAAEGNDRTAQPLRWFTLSGHFSSGPGVAGPSDARYLIVSVRHRATNNYQDGRGAESDYNNEIVCVPHTDPWRPGRNFNSFQPRIYGVQTALVVGPAGEEIYTDGFGRVKVQFHWDRKGEFNDESSAWIRVVSSWAGAGFGQISLPRVGMEVVVMFLDGNIDRPMIIGCVYNASNMPPWELPANKTQSGILTRSSSEGRTAHANALRFEDKRGAEELWLHAEKDQRIEVEHDESHWVGNDRKKTVDHDEVVEIKHDQNVTVHNNRTERVDHNEKISIGDNRTEDVGKNEDIDIGGNRAVSIGGHKKEQVALTKDERIGLGKALTIGAVYQTTVGGAMNTTVALAQLEEVGASKTVLVGDSSSLTAGTQHKMIVGSSSITITDGRIEIVADEILIRGNKKVQIHGDDIDNNPG